MERSYPLTMISKLFTKLRNPEYRKAFVASQINIGIPFQLRALMKARGWTQEKLAERTGMLQPRISAMLKPGKTRPNIETLRRLAEAFDCGLVVRFAPFSELVRWSERFDPESFDVPPFTQEKEQHFATGQDIVLFKPLRPAYYFSKSRFEVSGDAAEVLFNLRRAFAKPPQLSTFLYGQSTGPSLPPKAEHGEEMFLKKVLVPQGSSSSTDVVGSTIAVSQVS